MNQILNCNCMPVSMSSGLVALKICGGKGVGSYNLLALEGLQRLLCVCSSQVLDEVVRSCAQFHHPAHHKPGGWRGQVVCGALHGGISQEVSSCLEADLQEGRCAALNAQPVAGAVTSLQRQGTSFPVCGHYQAAMRAVFLDGP